MWLRRKRPSTDDDSVALRSTPHVILAGFGVQDRLQLTVETQRLLVRYGRAFTIGLPPTLRSFLKSLHVQLVELDDRFVAGRPFEEVYLDVIATVLKRSATERPVILLTQGNPLFMNTIARTLIMECRRLDLRVQILAGVSPMDVIVNDAGIDVGLFGLQVFDAHWLVANGLPISPRLPVMILNLSGFGLSAVPPEPATPVYAPLIEHLRIYYDDGREITLMTTNPGGGFSFGRGALGSLISAGERLATLTCLFIDAVQPQKSTQTVADE